LKFERYGKGIAKGLTVTIRHLWRRSVTTQYPEQRLTVSRRIRGNELVWNQNRCTGCSTCAKTCPQGVIRVLTSVDASTDVSVDDSNRYAVEGFEVDTGYCISCGLCIEACPYDALFMGYAYELGRYRREDLVLTRDQLMEDGKKASGYYRPEVAAELPLQTLLIDRDNGTEEA
jgi:NAD(P)H-quinone oxidoreductase subunit I